MTAAWWAAFLVEPRVPLAWSAVLGFLAGASWMYAARAGRRYRTVVRQLRWAEHDRVMSEPHPLLGPAWRRVPDTGRWTHEGPGEPTVTVSPGALWRSYAHRPADKPDLGRIAAGVDRCSDCDPYQCICEGRDRELVTTEYLVPEAGWYRVGPAGLVKVNDVDHGSGIAP